MNKKITSNHGNNKKAKTISKEMIEVGVEVAEAKTDEKIMTALKDMATLAATGQRDSQNNNTSVILTRITESTILMTISSFQR